MCENCRYSHFENLDFSSKFGISKFWSLLDCFGDTSRANRIAVANISRERLPTLQLVPPLLALYHIKCASEAVSLQESKTRNATNDLVVVVSSFVPLLRLMQKFRRQSCLAKTTIKKQAMVTMEIKIVNLWFPREFCHHIWRQPLGKFTNEMASQSLGVDWGG